MPINHDMMHAQSNDEVATLKARIAELERMDTEHTVQIAKMNAYIRKLAESQRWRNVDEELPTKDDASKKGTLLGCIGEKGNVHEYYLTDIVDSFGLFGITHWMPLPKAPEAK